VKTILVDAIGALITEKVDGWGVFKEMHVLLETFPNKKIILTGANDEQFRKFNLTNMPYEVFTLKHDPEKSDPLYYKKMLERFSLLATDVVYFEHDTDSVKSARSVGITTHHYHTEKKDLDLLKSFLVENL
jgi:FMN phosphatase YigB (HAD superfamily)